MLYYVLISVVQQSESAICIHICPIFGFPSHLVHQRALSRVPGAIQKVLIVSIVCTCQLQSPNPTKPLFPLGVHVFVLCVCVSISALQISSSISFF